LLSVAQAVNDFQALGVGKRLTNAGVQFVELRVGHLIALQY
jgi:hypothetical protein